MDDLTQFSDFLSIGRGNFGTVYRVKCHHDGKHRILKFEIHQNEFPPDNSLSEPEDHWKKRKVREFEIMKLGSGDCIALATGQFFTDYRHVKEILLQVSSGHSLCTQDSKYVSVYGLSNESKLHDYPTCSVQDLESNKGVRSNVRGFGPGDRSEIRDDSPVSVLIMTDITNVMNLEEWMNLARNLSTEIRKRSTMEILVNISRAIEYLHCKQVAHCDIRPANIFLFLDEDKLVQKAYLGDLGIAKFSDCACNLFCDFISDVEDPAPDAAMPIDIFSFFILAGQLSSLVVNPESDLFSRVLTTVVRTDPKIIEELNRTLFQFNPSLSEIGLCVFSRNRNEYPPADLLMREVLNLFAIKNDAVLIGHPDVNNDLFRLNDGVVLAQRFIEDIGIGRINSVSGSYPDVVPAASSKWSMQAVSCKNGGVPIQIAGDLAGRKLLSQVDPNGISTAIYSAIQVMTSDSGTQDILGRRISYSLRGGLRGFLGWHWYSTVTDLATGIVAEGGGPEKRCRGRKCALEEGIKSLFRKLKDAGKVSAAV